MKLTDTERATLNEAMAILQSKVNYGAVLNISAQHYRNQDPSMHVDYFDSRDCDYSERQHIYLKGETLADKVQAVLDIEAALPTPEETRAARLKQLREELAKLENAA